jgi:hypothetical protein
VKNHERQALGYVLKHICMLEFLAQQGVGFVSDLIQQRPLLVVSG